MDALVTGATGFLGGRLVRKLLGAGERVRVLVRDLARAEALASLGAEVVCGDLTDRASVLTATESCASVFHVGALSAPWGRREAFLETNVDGTRNIIDGCIRGDVGRLVFVSSPSVVFDGTPHVGSTEDAPYARRFLSAYSESKKLAEEAVLAAGQLGLGAVVLRPKAIFGPGDTALLPRIVDAARRGRLVQIGDGTNRVDLTYVDNVVDALVVARNAGHVRGVFTITNDEHPGLWPSIRRVVEGLGLPGPRRRIPVRAAMAWARALEVVATASGREPLLTRYSVAILSTGQTYDVTRARVELGYSPAVTVEEGLERTIAAFREAR